MHFAGKLSRDGKWWLAEVPIFGAMTQGRSRKEALEMIADWFTSMVGRRDFKVRVHAGSGDEFEVSSDDLRTMVSMMLRRQRQQSGLTLGEVADRLEAKSRNAYARYEQGLSVPSVEKLDELLRAIAPDRPLVVSQGNVA